MPRQVQTKARLDEGVHRKSVGIFDPTDDTMMSVLAHAIHYGNKVNTSTEKSDRYAATTPCL